MTDNKEYLKRGYQRRRAAGERIVQVWVSGADYEAISAEAARLKRPVNQMMARIIQLFAEELRR